MAVTYDDGMFDYEGNIAKTFGNDSKATFFLNGNSQSLLPPTLKILANVPVG